ncbi:hypothetical protein CFN78_23130 [Amycolatopsis antarctica]|uniref:Uncharacterized protein n=1 Tax=Amycolatopsis antarctica TaxID=1854586 RepID=A0A263CZI6_9PSEU|nr:hypothetical protein [Amycolatopsis antarctica]OZM70817.1 hypothetical protein CFN78_23130 [Amycolatopsis antarctica]
MIVPSGKCLNAGSFGGSGNVEQINVFGHDGAAKFLVTTGNFRASKGGNVITYGTPQDAWALTPSV